MSANCSAERTSDDASAMFTALNANMRPVKRPSVDPLTRLSWCKRWYTSDSSFAEFTASLLVTLETKYTKTHLKL